MKSYASHLFRETVCSLGELIRKESDFVQETTHLQMTEIMTAYIQDLGALLAPERVEEALERFDEAAEACLYGALGLLALQGEDTALSETWCFELKGLLSRTRARIAARKKVVVLTITAGNGHKAAAYAIEAGLYHQYGGDYIVSVHDIQADIGAIYESAVKHSANVYNWFFEGTNSQENIHILHNIGHPMFSKKLDQIFYAEQPDLVVSTFAFPGMHMWIKKTLRAQDTYIPYVTVITDSITIHFLWLAEGTDAYIVPNEETKTALAEKGVPKSLMHVLGFPVHPRFYAGIDRDAQRVKEGLDPEKPLFLLSVGTGGNMKDVDFLMEFDKKYGDKAQCVVVFGKNADLLHKMQKKRFGPGIKLLGWVSDMDRWMKMSDVMLTKAGGATVMECVAVEMPMIITRALAWQESGNAQLVSLYELGTVLENGTTLMDAIGQYVENPSLIAEHKANFKKLNAGDATARVVGFLSKLMDGGKISLH